MKSIIKSLYLCDYEYYWYQTQKNRVQLVTNPDDIYDGKILDIQLENDKISKMNIKEFRHKNLEEILYLKRTESDKLMIDYFSKQKQGIMASYYEQPPIFLINLKAFYDEEKHPTCIKLNLKRENGKTIHLIQSGRNYIFADAKDHEEFKITSRAVASFMEYSRYLPNSLDRMTDFILEEKSLRK